MAVGILNTVIDTAEANNAIEVTEMVIEIGKLAMLNPEQLKFMLGALCQHYMPMIFCPECESHRVEVINGRDINVKNISVELEDDEEN